jgi:hypothetical protein
MHDGTAPTTAQRLREADQATPDVRQTTVVSSAGVVAAGRGSLGAALAADYPPVHADRRAHRSWGPAALAVPLSLGGSPGCWRTVGLPDVLAAECGVPRVDLAETAARRNLPPIWMETGGERLEVDVGRVDGRVELAARFGLDEPGGDGDGADAAVPARGATSRAYSWKMTGSL